MQQPKNTKNPVAGATTSQQADQWPDGLPKTQKEIDAAHKRNMRLLAKQDRAKEREAKRESDRDAEEAARDKITPLEVCKQFADVFGQDWRFDTDSERWLRWSEKSGHWRFDDRYELKADISSFLAGLIKGLKALPARAIRETKRFQIVRETELYLRLERTLRVALSEHPMPRHLLQVPGAVIDLRTGEQLPPDRDLLQTGGTAVAPDFKAKPERWLRFLDEVSPEGDKAGWIAYLQRFCGYYLTGEIGDHRTLLLWGEGTNGKNTVWELLSKILGDTYFAKAETKMLESRGFAEGHSTEITVTRPPRRLVVVSEIQDRHLNVGRFKDLTGDRMIAGRGMRQDSTSWERYCKLLLVGNHKPRLQTVDEAMRRRIRLLAFVQCFKGRIDPNLEQDLEAEAGGVLAWALEGATKFYEAGRSLGDDPEIVTLATSRYLEEQDLMRRWLKETVQLGQREEYITTSALKRSFEDWAEENAPDLRWKPAKAYEIIEREFGAPKRKLTAGADRNKQGFTGLKLTEV